MRGCASDVVDRRFTYAAVGLLLLKSEIARGLSSKQAGQVNQGLAFSATSLGTFTATRAGPRIPGVLWSLGGQFAHCPGMGTLGRDRQPCTRLAFLERESVG